MHGKPINIFTVLRTLKDLHFLLHITHYSLLITSFFLLPFSLFPQSVSHTYHQFLNTSKWDFGSNYSTQNFQYDFALNSTIQKLNQKQIRDELNFEVSCEQPVFDSLSVYGKLTTLSVFLDQQTKTRNFDWNGISGLRYRNDFSNSKVGAGTWTTEQLNIQQTGRAIEFENKSNFDFVEVLNTELSANYYEGKTDNRYFGKSNFQVNFTVPETDHFFLQYQKYNLKRDYLASGSSSDIKLNYRYESTDRLSGNITYPLLDVFIFKYQLNVDNRLIKRFSDLANQNAPNTQTESITSENRVEISTHFRNLSFRLESNLISDDETYKVTETAGLEGDNYDIQNNKLKKRNNNSNSFNLKPSIEYETENFRSATSGNIQVDHFYNPQNDGYDDRDLGLLGIQQNLTWTTSKTNYLDYLVEYQHLHQVFIDRVNSGDNFRNHYLRIGQVWQFQPTLLFHNKLSAFLTSQIRVYDFDDRFAVRKSFTFRSILVEDSLNFNQFGLSQFIKLKSSENLQGKFFAKSFSELPFKSFSLYSMEYGLFLFTKKMMTSLRFINQDQFFYNQGKWILIQKIRQYGPVLQYTSQRDENQLTADIWLQFQTIGEKKAEFLPSVLFSYQIIF